MELPPDIYLGPFYKIFNTAAIGVSQGEDFDPDQVQRVVSQIVLGNFKAIENFVEQVNAYNNPNAGELESVAGHSGSTASGTNSNSK